MKISNQAYLKDQQYKTHDNLQARITLHRRFGTNRYPWQSWVFDHLALQPGQRVLEIGCGPGGLWGENLERLPAGLQATLGDYSPGMAAAARQAVLGAQGFTFANLDAQALSFSSATFDLVVANHMLYHVPEIPRALAEIRRVLKPGGKLVAATNGVLHMAELTDLIQRFQPGYAEVRSQAQRFTLENGSAFLKEFFPDVQVEIYRDDLVVTEVEPLRAYILTLWDAFQELDEPQMKAALVEMDIYLDHLFNEKGEFRIRKSQGVLVALSPR